MAGMSILSSLYDKEDCATLTPLRIISAEAMKGELSRLQGRARHTPLILTGSSVTSQSIRMRHDASRLLAPACVLWGCGVRSAEDIERLCDISRAAAEFRWSRMQELYRRQRFLTSPLERLVYAQFEDYIKGHRLPGAGR